MSGYLGLGAVAAALVLGSGADPRLAPSVILGAGAVAGIGWLVQAATPRRRLGLALFAVATGAAAIGLRSFIAPPVVPATAPLPPGTGPWGAVVESVGSLRDGDRPAIVELEAPGTIRLAATLPAWPIVVPGDRVTIDGALERRPDGEYGAYLERIGASGIVRARSVSITATPEDAGRALEGLRRGADEALSLAIPEPEAGLASGILIGLRDRVDRGLAAAFTAVGATHVVAISGWNIAIVAATLGALAGRVARRRRAALTAAAIIAYVVFVGASPSVVRAAAMAAVVLLARELGRPSRAAASIGWAITALLVVDPRLVDDVGFRLSALATAGLIAWGTPLTTRLSGAAPGRARAWLAESLGISLAAQLATLPIVALEFGRLSIVSPAINLGVVPLVAPAMAAGAVALVAGGLSLAGAPGVVAVIGGLPAWGLLAGIVGLVRVGAAVPFASLDLVAPWDIVVAASAAAVIVGVDRWLRGRRAVPGGRAAARPSRGAQQAARPLPAHPLPARPLPAQTPRGQGPPAPLPRGQPRLALRLRLAGRHPRWPRGRAERILAGGLAAAVLALTVAVVHRPDGIARLTILDVGQGDAILLEGQRGGRLLVDGGPDPGRLLVALDEHLPPWDRRIDAIVLTHPHEDHAAGLAVLIGRYDIKRVLEAGMIGPGPGYAALNAVLAQSGSSRGVLQTGDHLAVDDVRLRVLWPDPGTVPETPPDTGTGINNVSIVLLGEVNRHRFLLTGDIEEQIDPTLVARGLPNVEVLKVAHHGSRTSSTEAFLEAVDPAIAVISSGRGNPYGHPAAATVTRIEDAGAHLLRTDTNGSVEIDLGPGPIRVHPARGKATVGAALLTAAVPAPRTVATPTVVPPGSTSAFLCGLPLPPPSSIEISSRESIPAGPPPASPPVAPTALGLLSPDHRPTLGYDAPDDHPIPGDPGRPSAVLELATESRSAGRRSRTLGPVVRVPRR
jgi:competence protein ComEC